MEKYKRYSRVSKRVGTRTNGWPLFFQNFMKICLHVESHHGSPDCTNSYAEFISRSLLKHTRWKRASQIHLPQRFRSKFRIAQSSYASVYQEMVEEFFRYLPDLRVSCDTNSGCSKLRQTAAGCCISSILRPTNIQIWTYIRFIYKIQRILPLQLVTERRE